MLGIYFHEYGDLTDCNRKKWSLIIILVIYFLKYNYDVRFENKESTDKEEPSDKEESTDKKNLKIYLTFRHYKMMKK